MRHVISMERILEIQSIDPDGKLFHELIQYFEAQSAREIEVARQGLVVGQTEQVQRALHKLKNLFGNIGAMEGVSICANQEWWHGPQKRGSVGDELSRLETLRSEALQELRSLSKLNL